LIVRVYNLITVHCSVLVDADAGTLVVRRRWSAGSVVATSMTYVNDISASVVSYSRRWQSAVISTSWALKKRLTLICRNWQQSTAICSVSCIQTNTRRNVTYVHCAICTFFFTNFYYL